MAVESQQRTKTISIQILLVAGFIAQVVSIVPLWGHESDGGAFLGRYSNRYAIILIAHAVIAVSWLLLVIWRHRVENVLRRLPSSLIFGVALVTALALAGIWLTSAEEVIKQYLSLTWLTAILILWRSLPDRPARLRQWTLACLIVSVLLLVPMLIGMLASRHFGPDEAFWADSSASVFTHDGMYSHATYRPQLMIEPGYGWLNAGYGWLLHNVTFDRWVGRTWQFVTFLIAFAGIGAVAARLYGKKVALVAVTVAILSQVYIPVIEYRPNHQIPAVATFVAFFVLQARHSRRPWAAGLWNLACGLLATLSIQVHASGVILAVAFSLYYLIEFAWRSYRQRRLADMRPMIAFGIGALVGTAFFYQFNLVPAGGLGPYLERLETERGAYARFLPSWQRLLNWPGLSERFLVWLGALYLLWRRSEADKRLLSIVAIILLVAVVFDTQGYRSVYNAFLLIPIAVLLVDGFSKVEIPRGFNRTSALATGAVVFVMILEMWGAILSNPAIWDWFRTGQLPPFFYKEIVPVLAPYIRPDDTVVSTHQLIWGFPDIDLVSHATAGAHVYGKIAAKNGPFDSELALWEDVHPTLIIYIEKEMNFDPGLQEYMTLHEFQVCAETEFQNRDIRIYRTSCP